MWLHRLHWRYQPELFEWNGEPQIQTRWAMECVAGVEKGQWWRHFSVWEEGMSSSCTWTSTDGGQRHQSREVPERLQKLKNMIAKDSTGGRWLWDPKTDGGMIVSASFPFLVKDGGLMLCRKKICVLWSKTLLPDSICFLCEIGGATSPDERKECGYVTKAELQKNGWIL